MFIFNHICQEKIIIDPWQNDRARPFFLLCVITQQVWHQLEMYEVIWAPPPSGKKGKIFLFFGLNFGLKFSVFL